MLHEQLRDIHEATIIQLRQKAPEIRVVKSYESLGGFAANGSPSLSAFTDSRPLKDVRRDDSSYSSYSRDRPDRPSNKGSHSVPTPRGSRGLPGCLEASGEDSESSATYATKMSRALVKRANEASGKIEIQEDARSQYPTSLYTQIGNAWKQSIYSFAMICILVAFLYLTLNLFLPLPYRFSSLLVFASFFLYRPRRVTTGIFAEFSASSNRVERCSSELLSLVFCTGTGLDGWSPENTHVVLLSKVWKSRTSTTGGGERFQNEKDDRAVNSVYYLLVYLSTSRSIICQNYPSIHRYVILADSIWFYL